MKPHEHILSILPNDFSRQDFMNKTAEETAFSYRHARNLFQRAISEGVIVQTEKKGEYQKYEFWKSTMINY